jgi:hypothetical protein
MSPTVTHGSCGSKRDRGSSPRLMTKAVSTRPHRDIGHLALAHGVAELVGVLALFSVAEAD